MTAIYNRSADKDKRKRLRNELPPAEARLWTHLQGRQADGYKFRRQYGVGPFVIDFYCPGLKLAIEIDGFSHADESVEIRDRDRQAYIESLGIRVIRFTNAQIYESIEGVVESIL